ncbi:hypothetical protein TSH7_01270 [Azospirillum sp. TSH7]|uniref:hypothetical protein n=1 Tax=unclassified Azospirillum TaxID=2630922 RepID=UPI000D610EDE|nr:MULTISPECIES: hypothetical protein [unclassified Azospirillum]PWC69104.1 hypothetical protein TSH7_01270 [Azospirillum sp. TSH7]PWC71404.1 hypothetical protein TSH20_03805 [Azospirillum sp. TSH20]
MPTLTVSAPVADRSLVSLATVKAELGITDTASDTMLTRWIKELSDSVCEVCGVAADQAGRRTFLSEGVTIAYRAQEIPEGLDPAPLILPWRVPVSISTVTVDGTALTVADDVEVEPMAGLLWRLNADGCRTRWEQSRTLLTGTAGWALSDVPAAISSAVTDAVRYRWYAHTRGDPLLRSYENPDVEKLTYTDTDKVEMTNGLPDAVVGRLAPYTNMVIG